MNQSIISQRLRYKRGRDISTTRGSEDPWNSHLSAEHITAVSGTRPNKTTKAPPNESPAPSHDFRWTQNKLIDHYIILNRLDNYVGNRALAWIKSYLSSRHQFIAVNEEVTYRSQVGLWRWGNSPPPVNRPDVTPVITGSLVSQVVLSKLRR